MLKMPFSNVALIRDLSISSNSNLRTNSPLERSFNCVCPLCDSIYLLALIVNVCYSKVNEISSFFTPASSASIK